MAYTLYWIHHNKQTDCATEGYIGITRDIRSRFATHLSGKTSIYLKRALEKYNDEISFDVLQEFDTEEQARKAEEQLRPKPRIGWNIAPGGGYPPNIKDHPEAIEKIKNTIKSLGMTPYSEKTHSKEALEKAKATKKSQGWKWYHNPETLEYRIIPTEQEPIPEGWVSGRKPKPVIKKKVRGRDYYCNVMCVNVYKNGELIAEDVKNFKQWCGQNNLPYFAGSRTDSVQILKQVEKISLEKQNGLVVENGVCTQMNQKDYSRKINRSEGYVSSALKRGYYEIKHYDVYSFVKR